MASSLLIILRMYVHFDKYDNPPKLTRPWTFYRIAIWHKNKIVSAISMALWIANIGTIVNGKYLQQILGESIVNLLI